jgi:hypothetical protein
MKGTIRGWLKDILGAIAVFVIPVGIIYIAYGFGF